MNLILTRIAEQHRQLTSIFDKKEEPQAPNPHEVIFSINNKKDTFEAFKNDNPNAPKDVLKKVKKGLKQCNVMEDVQKLYNNLTNFQIGNVNVKLNFDALKNSVAVSCDLNQKSNVTFEMGKNNLINAQYTLHF